MDNELNVKTTDDINEYMKFFLEQPLKEKQNIIYEQLRLLASLTNRMCKEIDAPNEVLINRELLDMNNEEYTQDDFAEAVIVLINSIQNSICDYVEGISKLLDYVNENPNS